MLVHMRNVPSQGTFRPQSRRSFPTPKASSSSGSRQWSDLRNRPPASKVDGRIFFLEIFRKEGLQFPNADCKLRESNERAAWAAVIFENTTTHYSVVESLWRSEGRHRRSKTTAAPRGRATCPRVRNGNPARAKRQGHWQLRLAGERSTRNLGQTLGGQ